MNKLYIPEDLGETGLEDYDQSEVGIPRLNIMQPNSKAVVEGIARPGDILCTSTNKVLERPVNLIIYRRTYGASLFRKGQGLVCRSDDGITSRDGASCLQCPFDECWSRRWRVGEEPPKCKATIDFIVALEEEPSEIYMLTMKSASFKVGKNIVKEHIKKYGIKTPLWCLRFKFDTVMEERDDTRFFLPKITEEEAFSKKAVLEHKPVFSKIMEIYRSKNLQLEAKKGAVEPKMIAEPEPEYVAVEDI